MIVADTNLIIYFFITGDQSEAASAVMAVDADWVVPPLWQSEFRNTLVQYMRHGIIHLNDAVEIMNAAEERLSIQEYGVSSAQVLRLAQASSCSAYDCEFVALAQQLDVPFITADRKILVAFPHIARSPQQFLGQER